MKKSSTSQHLTAGSISPSTAGVPPAHAVSISAGTGIAMQKQQKPRKWDLGATSMLGCRSAGIKYLNSFLTECMKQFYVASSIEKAYMKFSSN